MTARPVAMVLSGGGAKAAAHLGAYRAVREAGFEPAWFVAASMGAVVAAGLASGVGHDELLEKIAGVGGRSIVRDPLAPVAGLFLRSLLKPAPLRRLDRGSGTGPPLCRPDDTAHCYGSRPGHR